MKVLIFQGSNKSEKFVQSCALNHDIKVIHLPMSKCDYNIFLMENERYYDLVVCLGWPYKTHDEVIQKASALITTIHESPLPYFKGFAPVSWSILEGFEFFGLTFFQQTSDVDSGPLIYQLYDRIKNADTSIVENALSTMYDELGVRLDDILQKSNRETIELHHEYDRFKMFFPKRTPLDSKFNEGSHLQEMTRLANSCRAEYPAFICVDEKKWVIHTINGRKVHYFDQLHFTNSSARIYQCVDGSVLKLNIGNQYES